MKKRLLLVIAVLGLMPLARAADAPPERGFVDRVCKDEDGNDTKYVVFVPHDYKADKPYPTIVFLHGSGKCGTDGRQQLTNGLPLEIKAQEKSFNRFLVVCPQAQKKELQWRGDSKDGKRVLTILADVEKSYKVDSKRVYLTGLSMGGYGVWSLAAHAPERWAAIVPICGAGDPKDAGKIKQIPCWCWHGDADKSVPVERSREMIKALKDAGATPKYSELADVGHSSYKNAYASKELFDWLLAQQLAPVVSPRKGKSETIKLFNGKDLDGWEGHATYWSVKDGAIVARNDKPVKVSTYLLTKQKFTDFRLTATVKLVESEKHSGIAFWGQVTPDKGDDYTYAGHLVMFPSEWGMHDLYGRNKLSVDGETAKKAGKQHDWNNLEILAQGNRVRLVVNGVMALDWRDPEPERIKEGPIGLQLHFNKIAQEVHFKDLMLTTFPEEKLLTVK